MGNSSVGNSDTVAHQTMSDDTTMGNAMSDTDNCSGEGSSAIVSDFGDISVNVVGVVVDVLDPSVRQVDGVVSLPGSGAIIRLLGVETGSRVVVSHGVLVGVGGDLVRVDWHSVGHGMTHYSVANSNSMSDANSMAKADTMANPSKQLRTSRGSSHKSGDRNESLKDEI